MLVLTLDFYGLVAFDLTMTFRIYLFIYFVVTKFGMEGKGFEPNVETLFGSNGFFPDSISKAMYWAGDKMPNKINEVLQEWVEPLRTEKTKRQVLISIAYSKHKCL